MSEEQTSSEESAAVEETDQTATETTTETTSEVAETTETTLSEDKPTDAWGDDWRQNYADGDEKMAKRLERYSSPKNALDALVAAQNKISSGEMQTTLKADATDEERADWRETNGVPATPDGYEVNLFDGLVVGEADKPMVDSFLESAHAGDLIGSMNTKSSSSRRKQHQMRTHAWPTTINFVKNGVATTERTSTLHLVCLMAHQRA